MSVLLCSTSSSSSISVQQLGWQSIASEAARARVCACMCVCVLDEACKTDFPLSQCGVESYGLATEDSRRPLETVVRRVHDSVLTMHD